MPTGSIPEFLLWLASSAGLTALMSLAYERWPWFQNLPTNRKIVIIAPTVILLPQLILVVTNVVPASVWVALQPYWREGVTSVTTLAAFFSLQLAHKVDKRLTKSS
jgi:uncharacterized membrane-anchored protein